MSPRPPIADSPWFWACLFASMALVALWAMGPKYGDRQLLIENKAQGRLRAAEGQAGGEMTTEVSSPGHLSMPLRSLYGIVSGLLVLAWAALWWSHFRLSARDATTPKQLDGQAPLS